MMTDRQVYTSAAEQVDRTDTFTFSCNAIYHPTNKNNIGTPSQRTKYRVAFGFERDINNAGECLLMYDQFLYDMSEGLTNIEARQLRVLCLLMMAAACGDL